MKRNNEIIDNNTQDIEVYKNDIYRLVDDYILNVLQINENNYNSLKEYKEDIKDSFVDMIYYIHDNMNFNNFTYKDIEVLDYLFNIYTRLCTKYNVLPTLECFSFLVGVNRATFSDWMHETTRANTGVSHTVKKWFNICKAATVNRLNNQNGTNANLIFTAKAAYGMAETAPVQTQTAQGIPQQTAGQIAERYREVLEIPQEDMPEL